MDTSTVIRNPQEDAALATPVMMNTRLAPIAAEIIIATNLTRYFLSLEPMEFDMLPLNRTCDELLNLGYLFLWRIGTPTGIRAAYFLDFHVSPPLLKLLVTV
jgi:hypothetical protein